MDLLTYFTPSHAELYRDYFGPSYDEHLRHEFNLLPFYQPEQICPRGEYFAENWTEAVRDKIVKVRDYMANKDTGTIFVFSDVDVVFFEPIGAMIETAIRDHDFVFQNDLNGQVCTGFYACRISDRTRSFIEELLQNFDADRGDDQGNFNHVLGGKVKGDQFRTNQILAKRIVFKNTDVKVKMFDRRVRSVRLEHVGKKFLKPWEPGDAIPFSCPYPAVFHANWTVGVKNKIALIKAYQKRFGNDQS